jgi:Holliday junction resolvase RusA-like endonuclease
MLQRRTVRISFWLPFPPSVNRLWRYDRGRVHLATAYVRWKRHASAAAREQDLFRYPVLGRHTLKVELSERFIGRGGDADNRLKAVGDWCQRVHLIIDDADCRKATIEWADIDRDCLVTLRGEIADGEYAALVAARRAIGRAVA